MIDQAVAQPLGDLMLERLEFGIDKFEHRPCFHIYEMIVMRIRHGLVSRIATPEVVPLDDTRFLEEPNRSINRSKR